MGKKVKTKPRFKLEAVLVLWLIGGSAIIAFLITQVGPWIIRLLTR